ncbi:MAG: hypothetical protein Q9160_005090 [Pyrenula sp. 1 TL-2023]
MPPPRRRLQATAQETLEPPSQLGPNHIIARVDCAAGNNLWSIQLPPQTDSNSEHASLDSPPASSILVELPSRFRSQIWLKRGTFVLVQVKAGDGTRDNKIRGEIINIVGDEKIWRKELKGRGWPAAFGERRASDAPNSRQGSPDESPVRVGDMPPTDNENLD